MTDRELMQQALDTLEDSHQNINPQRRYADELTRQIGDAITALRERLVQPEQEPVAYVSGYYAGRCVIEPLNQAMVLPEGMALFTALPRREWVSLTDEEIEAAIGTAYPEKPLTMYDKRITQAIEAKLKERNSG